MRAGQLRSRITIFSRTTDKDEYAAVTEEYTKLCSMRAEVRYLKGAELMMSSTVANTTTLQFITRYRSGISEDMEVEYSGDRYAIRIIEISGKKQMLKITATKIVN